MPKKHWGSQMLNNEKITKIIARRYIWLPFLMGVLLGIVCFVVFTGYDRMKIEKIADETILKAVKLLTKERNSIWGVDTMNAYVHSNKLSPVPIDIQTTWDNIQDFLVILENFC